MRNCRNRMPKESVRASTLQAPSERAAKVARCLFLRRYQRRVCRVHCRPLAPRRLCSCFLAVVLFVDQCVFACFGIKYFQNAAKLATILHQFHHVGRQQQVTAPIGSGSNGKVFHLFRYPLHRRNDKIKRVELRLCNKRLLFQRSFVRAFENLRLCRYGKQHGGYQKKNLFHVCFSLKRGKRQPVPPPQNAKR